MSAIASIVLEDLGWADVTLRGLPPVNPETGQPDGEAPVITRRIDVYDVHDRWAAYHLANTNKPANEYSQGLVALIQEFGFPEVSQAMALKFIKTIINQVEAIKKVEAVKPA